MTQQSEADQRRYIRFELFEYALAYVPAFAEPRQVVVVNIGLGGLQLRSREPLPVGTLCKLGISTIDLPMLMLPVEIRHCVPVPGSDLFSVGMRFKPMTHEDRLTIANFVHEVFQRQCDLLSI